MLTRSKRLGGLVAIAAASVLAISACGSSGGGGGNAQQSSAGFATCDDKPDTCNTAPTKAGGTLTVALEKKVQNWNTFDSDGNTFETGQVMNGLVLNPYIYLPSGGIAWNQDLFTEEPKITNQTPQTVVYKLRQEAVWDDGEPMTALDFQMFWKFNNGESCPDCSPASDTGYKDIKSVEASDNNKTVTVTFKDGVVFPDWKSLFQMWPSHLAAKQGDLNTPAGLLKGYEFFKGTPTWSGGAYKFAEYQKDVLVKLVPNPKWFGKTKPSLESITFRIIEDQAQQIPALQNKEVQMLISQPNADMVQKIQGMAGVQFHLGAGPTWEHIDLNLKNQYLADVNLRKAMYTAANRQEIIDKTVGLFFKKAAPLNNHNFMPGAPGYKDVVTPTGQGKGDVEAAKKILTDAGYKLEGGKLLTKTGQAVPPLRFRYTTGNQLRQQTAELFQAQMKQIGVEIKIEPLTSLGGTLDSGDFDVIVYAWVGSPFNAGAADLWSTEGGSNFGKWSNPDADKLLKEASTTLDEAKVRDLLNQADEIMAKEAFVLPLFQKPVFIAVYSDYVNVRNNATLQGQTYNMQEWGLKA